VTEIQTEIESRTIILVVEDDVLIRMPIASYLRDCGYRVIEAADGDEALAVLAQAEINVEILLTDAEMPGVLDGFGLLKWVRENRPDIRAILAGTPSRAVSAAGGLCEETPWVVKPYQPQTVHDHIRGLLAARERAQ
jgi:CheY-like chemotaxis protein